MYLYLYCINENLPTWDNLVHVQYVIIVGGAVGFWLVQIEITWNAYWFGKAVLMEAKEIHGSRIQTPCKISVNSKIRESDLTGLKRTSKLYKILKLDGVSGLYKTVGSSSNNLYWRNK